MGTMRPYRPHGGEDTMTNLCGSCKESIETRSQSIANCNNVETGTNSCQF